MLDLKPSRENSKNKIKNYIKKNRPHQKEIKRNLKDSFNGSDDHFSKLYEDRKIRERRIEEAQMLKEKKEMEKCTFMPKLLKSSKSQSSLNFGRSDFFESMHKVWIFI
jgi:hypothetical protein